MPANSEGGPSTDSSLKGREVPVPDWVGSQ